MTDDIENKIKLKKLPSIYETSKANQYLITKSKERCYQHINTTLSDPSLSDKTYWSIVKTFFSVKKVPIISPLFINSKFDTDFQEKANVFNSFLAKQCLPVPSSSVLFAEIS